MTSESWTPLKVLTWTAGRFGERGIDSARLDAELLLAHVLGTSRVALYTSFDKPLSVDELARYRELVKRRLAGEPVAYLVGEQEFWSLALHVDEHVLIPRRDTETLVEVALKAARSLPPGRIRLADVCTGSGAVAIALASELPEAEVVATDASDAALQVASANVARHGLAERVQLRAGDLCAPLDGHFAIIAANPPYIPTGSLAGLAAEVRREPALALDGGADGLTVLRRIIGDARTHLDPGGTLAVEHGFDQAAAVAALCAAAGYERVTTTRDLAGVERVTSGTTGR